RHDTHWREEHRTPSTDTLIGFVWQALDVEVDPAHHQATVRAVEEGLLHGAPDFAEGLTDALAWAADRYPLAIISDTMFSPGRVIRQLLDQRGTLKAFSAFVFSDEVGFSKPDRRAFDQAAAALEVRPDEVLHIGDLRRTDIAGARGAGALGALYTGIHTDDGHPAQPHVHLASWADLPQTLAQLDG
ncbi:MAG: HAD-IA family hydrolase, partial [Bacteroidota bacterium]